MEGRSIYSKKCRRTMGTCNNPIALLEGLEDLLPLGFLQEMVQCAVCCGIRSSGSFLRMTDLGRFQISHIDTQGRTRRDNYGALDYILKFSYVPWPMISAQGIHCRGWNCFHDLFHASGKLLRKVPHQERNIPLAFPQGRNVDGKNIQTKEEIGSELLLGHHHFQIAVRRGNQARVGPKRARASQPLELPLLQDAEQFGLQFERNFSYFVQENRAAIGHFEAANPLRDRSCECAFLMSEQLAFQQARRNCRAVELDEGLRATGAQIMNGSRNQFFSRARFPINENRRIRRCYGSHFFEDSAQRCASSDDLGKIHFRADFIFQIEFFLRELLFQFPNLAVGKCILDGESNLVCNLAKETDISLTEGIVPEPAENQDANSAIPADQG